MQTDTGGIPMNYNETRMVLMARDPHCLFAYWEVSESMKAGFMQEFGQAMWDRSVPVIKVVNVTKGNEFIIRINDFSESWYINIPDPGCTYIAEVGRRVSDNFFISLAGSNPAAVPGNLASEDRTAVFADHTGVRTVKTAARATIPEKTVPVPIYDAGTPGPSSIDLQTGLQAGFPAKPPEGPPARQEAGLSLPSSMEFYLPSSLEHYLPSSVEYYLPGSMEFYLQGW